ncbi:aminotriazole resistance protein [[Candida] anglica]
MFDERPIHLKSFPQEIAVVMVICMAQFLTQGGVTMCLSTMNLILESFAERSNTDIEPTLKVWFMGSYALTVGTFILISGRIGDIVGLKKVFITGWIWVTVWSLISGLSVFSNSITFFIICRAFQGIGFALLLPCGLGILGFMYAPGSRKNFVFGLVGASGPVGATIGALMAAVIAQLGWWPWEFWALSIASTCFGIISYFTIPHLKIEDDSKQVIESKLKQFDFLGSICGVFGLILLNFCWNQGPVANWSAYIIVLLILSVLAIVGFFYLEIKVVENPLLPRCVFNYKIGLVLICIALGWGSFGVWQYYYWVIVLNFKHYTPIEGSVAFMPFLVLGCIAAMLCSYVISRTRPSYIILFSTIAFMCGDIMLSVTPIDQSYFRVLFGQMFLLAWGMDLSFPAATIILSDCLPKHYQGMAGSLVATVVNYSVSLALGIASVVETETLQRTNDDLKSIRTALHFGTGLAAGGVLFSIVFVIVQHINNDMGTMVHKDEEEKTDTSSTDEIK